MGTNRSLATCDEREQRAALRETILQHGRQIGWPTRSAIVFTERATRRPWKRCTADQLWTVLDEIDAILQVCALTDPRQNSLFDRNGRQSRNGALYAHRH